MVKNLNLDISARGLDRGLLGESASLRGLKEKSANSSDPKKGSRSEFADQLFGGRDEKLEGPVRNESAQKPGRASSPKTKSEASREGERSVERESDSQKPLGARMKAEGPKKREKELSKDDPNPSSEPQAVQAMAQSPTPIQDKKIPNISTESVAASEGISQATNAPAQISGQALPAERSAQSGEELGFDPTALGLIRQNPEAQVRSQAMQDFLVRMQNEIGVSPEKVLEAFAAMDAQALMAPPEESMDQFIQNLDLTPQQSNQATGLFKEMIDATGAAALSEKIAGIESAAQLEIVGPEEQALQKLNASLDQLSQSFFRKEAQKPVDAEQAMEAMDAEITRLMRGQSEPKSEKVTTEPVAVAAGIGVMAPQQAVAKSSEATFSSNSGNGAFANLANGLSQAQAEIASKAKDGLETSEKFSLETSTASDGTSQMVPLANSTIPQQDVAAGGATAMLADRMQATPQQEQENIRELINRAQLIVKKGGGEMNLELKPEGVGQVKLKVSVEDGQVNVQMLAETESAKRLLEKGLNDLKANLAAHQLKVDTLKVDVSADVQKHMDQNSAGQDSARDQARQFAQDFMGQFREDRQAFRQGLFESPGMRSYGKKQNRASMEPEPIAAASAARKAEASRRLNLVA